MTALSEMLWDYALGLLDEGDVAKVETALEGSPALRAELAEITESATALAADLAPIKPSENVRARLLSSVAAGADRFAPFVAKLSAVFDLGAEAIRSVLERAAQETEWEDGPYPGARLFHFQGGPGMAAADCGFVRFPRGFTHPLHEHLGKETILVLSGSHTDSDGSVAVPGDSVVREAGTSHSYVVGGEDDYMIAIALEKGITVYPAGPDGPTITVKVEK